MNKKEKAELEKEFGRQEMKRNVYNSCLDAAISKAKLSATLISVKEIESIISDFEKLKR